MKPSTGFRLACLATLLAGLVTACSSPMMNPGTETARAAPSMRALASTSSQAFGGKRIVGYFCEWGIYGAHDNYYVNNIPFDKLTHINYAFVGINPSTLAVEVYDPWASLEIVYPGDAWDTPYKGNLGNLRKAKLAHPDLKVLISVGGWTKSHGFHAAAATDATRRQSAANLVAFMKTHGLDGVDIDWEYPGINRPADPNDPYDKGAPGGPEDKVNYTLFLKAIREELDRVGAADGRHYELTVAVGVGYDKIAVTDPAAYAPYLDAINLMTYDMHGGFETLLGHQAPLYANPKDPHEAQVRDKYNIDWAVNEFIRLGVPASKLVLGVPFYSRGWDNVSGGIDIDGNGSPDGMFGTGTGSLAGKWGIGGQNPYFTVKQLASTPGWEKHYDPVSKASWLYNRSAKQLLTYDDALAVATKMDYLKAKGLGGAMYWELDGDDWKNGYDLVNIIADKLKGTVVTDTQAPTVPGNPAASGVTHNALQLAWTASSDNVGVVAYRITGGPQSLSTAGTSIALGGLSPSTAYTFGISAVDAAGNASAAATIKVSTAPAPADTQAPTVPGTPLVSQVQARSVQLDWSASTDNVGVSSYELVRGSTVVATSASTTFTLQGLSPDTDYSIAVRARDAAGNTSAASQATTFRTLTEGGTDPILATGVPGTPNIQQDNWDGGATFNINMNMWWGNNGTTFQLWENGVLVASQTLKDNSPNPQSAKVSFANKAKGTYRYVAKLMNSFGVTSSAELTYTVR